MCTEYIEKWPGPPHNSLDPTTMVVAKLWDTIAANMKRKHAQKYYKMAIKATAERVRSKREQAV